MAEFASALGADWLGACRRAAEGLDALLARPRTSQERARETGGVGSGGDRTLVLDAEAETVVLRELSALREEGHAFRLISEECGEVDLGGGETIVIVDPIDGSLNAKRGIPHHSVSVAVASGPTMADVEFAYVYDFGPGEEWWARRGEGAWLEGELLDPSVGERRGPDGRIEVLGIESADPRWIAAVAGELAATSYRLRALGTIAASLCQVAAGRFDAMASLRRCRGVDAAAGQLIVREAGGQIAFARCAEPLGAPLSAEPVSEVHAARCADTLTGLGRLLT